MSIALVLSTAQSSGIAEPLEHVLSPELHLRLTLMVISASIILLIVAGYIIADRVSSTTGDVVATILAILALIGINIGGHSFISHIDADAKAEVHAATLQNVEENFDLKELEIRNIDQYSWQNVTLVSGIHQGRFIDFHVVYSSEYDTMLPIGDTAEDFIRPDSTLEYLVHERP